jgi:hypothetical protein
LKRATSTPSGIRKDLQQALAEIRTDLNVFTPAESLALMACSYQMVSKAFHRALKHLHELFDDGVAGMWPFAEMLKDITSTGRRDQLER